MKKTLALALAAGIAAPAAFAQTYTERITVYEAPRYDAFVLEEGGALQSGGKTLADTLLADDVAYALARDRKLDGMTVTVSANNGKVMLSGSADQEQSERARQIAQRVAGMGNVSGELSNTDG